MITFRDPKELNDWWLEVRYSSNRFRTILNWIYEDRLFVRRAIRQVDQCYTTAEFLNEKVGRKYGIKVPIDVLPTPIGVPSRPSIKSKTPTVCYVGRLDRRKRPELFFALAQDFPDVRFVVAGRSNDPLWEQRLVEKYGGLENLAMAGFVDQFGTEELANLYVESWIYVNTSIREGMPTAMLEAMAHGCAVLAHVDPNGVTTRFGKRVDSEDFANGLHELLEGNAWRRLGAAGSEYVRRQYSLERSIDKHIVAYDRLLDDAER
jgi:glycosyltransferase involved in cell wall biosynthesis